MAAVQQVSPAMSAPSTPHDAAPPAKGDAPGSGNIRDLIFQLEEQAALKHQRQLQAAEGEVAARERQITTLKGVIGKLKEDFEYNLGLIASRDDELAQFDATLAELQEAVRSRDVQLSEYQIQLAEKGDGSKQLEAKVAELQAELKAQSKQGDDKIIGVQWSGEEALRRQQEQFDRTRFELERKIEEQGKELELQRAEASTAVDDVLRGRDAADDALRAECRAAASAATAATARQESAEKQTAELRTLQAKSSSQLREVEAQLAAVTRQAEGAKADAAADLAKLRSELETAVDAREQAGKAHGTERQELLVKLQAAEQRCTAQSEDLTQVEPRIEAAMAKLQDALDAQFSRERTALTTALDDETSKSAKLTSELAQALRDVQRETAGREDAEAQRARLSQQLENVTLELGAREKKHSAEVGDGREHAAELQRQVGALGQQVEEMQREAAQATERAVAEVHPRPYRPVGWIGLLAHG